MQSISLASEAVDTPITDLGPLAWVFDELRKSLDASNKALKRFAADAVLARQSDLSAPDLAPLRIARSQLHQVLGALEMVGFQAPAAMVRGMEAAVQRFISKPNSCSEVAIAKMEKAGFALVEYLESVLSNKPVNPVSLFSQYRDVQELAAAQRVHPADLWPAPIKSVQIVWPVGLAPKSLVPGPDVRALFDRYVLHVMKTQHPGAAGQLKQVSAGLAAGSSNDLQRTFWCTAAAYFEAIQRVLLPIDVHVKRAASRVLVQYSAQAQGGQQVSGVLLHDLLFFAAQAQLPARAATPWLHAVRQAYGLEEAKPVEYEHATLGRYDPALLAQARKRTNAAKEGWTLLTGGDTAKARQVVDQLALVVDSLKKILPSAEPLGNALLKAVDLASLERSLPTTELGLEVATAILYLEAVMQDMDPNDPYQVGRMQQMAARVQGSHAGIPSMPLEGWMEDLYRRVSDRHTMGSVVGELKIALGELERSLDAFSRKPEERKVLMPVPQQLAQMRGVLSVLGLDHASLAVAHMRGAVEGMLTETHQNLDTEEAGSFSNLAHNLSALSFLIDMLNYQPVLARKLFVFDTVLGELQPLMGRAAPAVASTPIAELAEKQLNESVGSVLREAYSESSSRVDIPSLVPRLDSLADDAALAGQTSVAEVAHLAAVTVVTADAQAGAHAISKLVAATLPAASEAPLPETSHEPVEDDLLDIFLEEARDVIQAAEAALGVLAEMPDSMSDMTTLRRAFHTLKGSSRMVGLTTFGDAAWALEKVINEWLADSRPASPELCALCQASLQSLTDWVEDIASRSVVGVWKSEPFVSSADALRQEGRFQPLGEHESLPASLQTDSMLPEAFEDKVSAPFPTQEVPIGISDVGESGLDLLDIDFGSLDASMVVEVPQVELAPAQFEASHLPSLLFADSQAPNVEHDDLPTPTDLRSDDSGVGAMDEEPMAHEGFLLTAEDSFSISESEDVSTVVDSQENAPDLELASPHEVSTTSLTLDFGVADGFASEGAVGEEDSPSGLPMASDEDVKVIGPLRMGVRLFNVFLNEADEWSRRLSHEVAEWGMQHELTVPDTSAALAHSLAGASAAVGFVGLSELARALELALDTSRDHSERGLPATHSQASLFVTAADEICRLLHQFAAGFLKEPDSELLIALNEFVHQIPPVAEALTSLEPEIEGSERFAVSSFSETASEANVGAEPEPDLKPEPVPEPVQESVPELVPEPEEFLRGASATPESGAISYVDDDIDVLDTLDTDLFEFFEEEALELLPQLGAAMRQWVAIPGSSSSRVEVLRILHTFKGSARLAGALRLGEMAHRMETQIERLGSDVEDSNLLEPLLSNYDALVSRFDLLRLPNTTFVAHRVTMVPEEPAATTTELSLDDTQVSQPLTDDGPNAQLNSPATPLSLAVLPGLAPKASVGASVRVRADLLDRLLNQTGEVMITRSRMKAELSQLRGSLSDLTGNLDRLRMQLRDVEVQAESQMQSRMAQSNEAEATFDPLEFDRFTRVQELTRMMAESVNDVATVQRNLQRAVDATEDGLAAQARQTRELQRDLLRTRMVEFEGISDRLYRVVRQSAKETGKQVRLDIYGGSIEMDRGVLDRMTPAFEHLLRNCVGHGIEGPAARSAAGKAAEGQITIRLTQERNDVSVIFEDDGGGLDLPRIREKAIAHGLISSADELSDESIAEFIFTPGLTTATEITGLSGRGIGMDVVRSDVVSLGGQVTAYGTAGKGTQFRMVLPLTTAVTQVVLLRVGALTLGVPSGLVEVVRRVTPVDLEAAYRNGRIAEFGEDVPFFWAGALLQTSEGSLEAVGRTRLVVVFRSASQRVALHVDEVLGNQEVVVKNLGPQLSRLPGLTAMTILASGAVVLIYNPVSLAAVYGQQAATWVSQQRGPTFSTDEVLVTEIPTVSVPAGPPLVMVVDDSITVRRVTQRLLQREGYRVVLAADGLQALEKLAQERPALVLSDIEMPRMDGFDLVRNIRADEALANLPVIMITSRIAAKHREHARELGVDHYLGKPYPEDELLSLIQHYVAQQPA